MYLELNKSISNVVPHIQCRRVYLSAVWCLHHKTKNLDRFWRALWVVGWFKGFFAPRPFAYAVEQMKADFAVPKIRNRIFNFLLLNNSGKRRSIGCSLQMVNVASVLGFIPLRSEISVECSFSATETNVPKTRTDQPLITVIKQCIQFIWRHIERPCWATDIDQFLNVVWHGGAK